MCRTNSGVPLVYELCDWLQNHIQEKLKKKVSDSDTETYAYGSAAGARNEDKKAPQKKASVPATTQLQQQLQAADGNKKISRDMISAQIERTNKKQSATENLSIEKQRELAMQQASERLRLQREKEETDRLLAEKMSSVSGGAKSNGKSDGKKAAGGMYFICICVCMCVCVYVCMCVDT